ncbi:unnamed protein product (macronuclear) [Paramecium tetraurelia]|uniref:Glutaredoxin domain-containing protein n=1 Tax=Paramecium tetraurelia TaxID=5888 RepID=A0EED5_PARTE|nr:uncharacterized protein GSPATT00025998001 [Paramecium tetraurelia]CAK93653.1 unnamed protein product [Paramecium tetraurelia]|eukprot:XP_001461049.1 hypothetical protein (macronuclear) [Paramecium tetraurelia strain d4-2]
MGANSSNTMKPEEIKSDKNVVVYGSDNCPYCFKVKKIFEELKVQIDYRNIDENKEYDEQKQKLMNGLKYDTIPLVFIKNKFIGGCSNVKELEAKGELLSQVQ